MKNFTRKENYRKICCINSVTKNSQQNIRKLNSPIFKKDNAA